MFGLATEDDIRELKSWFSHQIEMRLTALMLDTRELTKKQAELENPKPKPTEPVKLYKAVIFKGPTVVAVYENVIRLYEFNGYLEVELTNGKARIANEGANANYSYSLTEQKPEGEKASFDYGGVSWLSQIDRRIDRLLDQPVNVRMLTLAREEMEREWAKKFDRVSRVVSGLTTDVCLLQGDVSTLKEITRDQAKNHDALNHRIEMLELRDKQMQVKKPQPKGAKR